jgi:hypothetical protein
MPQAFENMLVLDRIEPTISFMPWQSQNQSAIDSKRAFDPGVGYQRHTRRNLLPDGYKTSPRDETVNV